MTNPNDANPKRQDNSTGINCWIISYRVAGVCFHSAKVTHRVRKPPVWVATDRVDPPWSNVLGQPTKIDSPGAAEAAYDAGLTARDTGIRQTINAGREADISPESGDSRFLIGRVAVTKDANKTVSMTDEPQFQWHRNTGECIPSFVLEDEEEKAWRYTVTVVTMMSQKRGVLRNRTSCRTESLCRVPTSCASSRNI